MMKETRWMLWSAIAILTIFNFAVITNYFNIFQESVCTTELPSDTEFRTVVEEFDFTRHETENARVLILTPLKNAAQHLDRYFENLLQLDYPRNLLSLGFLESDSNDESFQILKQHVQNLERLNSTERFRRIIFTKKDFGYILSTH